MTHEPTGNEPLTPEEEQRVARLLADAAGPVPMPAHVAARLEDVLTELSAERTVESEHTGAPTGAPAGAPADELARRRERRRWPRLLLAAAAVVVGGYAVGTGTGALGGSDGFAGDSAGSEVAQEDSLRAGDPGRHDQDGVGAAGDTEAAPKAGQDSSASSLLASVRLRSDSLERDVRRALRLLDAVPATALSRELGADSTCPGPGLGNGERSLRVRYDGEPAVLVTGPAREGTVAATVHSCQGDVVDRVRVRR